MRITKVYTKQGDAGRTRLGGGQEIPKTNIRIRAYGTIDELNCILGLALSFKPDESICQILTRCQHQLLVLGGDLCVLQEDKARFQMKGIEPHHVTFLENTIDQFNGELEPLADFILPTGTPAAAFLHQARCVCRRAETLIVELSQTEVIGEHALPYINRLSDALFVLARYENFKKKTADILWDKDA